jgi:NADH-quinone oxidoreductase subunit N
VAFKLSAVPFHFWCPDVFEGAAAEVNAFLSVASKAAALGLLIRLAIGFTQIDPAAAEAHAQASPPAATTRIAATQVSAVQTSARTVAAANGQDGELSSHLRPVRQFLLGLISLLAAITCTFGNLAAYGQTNIKRLLAYSTIAHAGYMLMPVAAMIALLDINPGEAQRALGALCFYIAVYLFMNLGAFAVVAFLRNAMRSEEIADYAGLVRRSPGVVVCFSIMLLSLLGLPPLAGFSAKFVIFYPLLPAQLWLLLVIGLLNTVLSLFYYLRVVKVMALDPEPEDRLPVEFSLASLPGAFLVAVTIPILVLGIWWNDLNEWTRSVAGSFLS